MAIANIPIIRSLTDIFKRFSRLRDSGSEGNTNEQEAHGITFIRKVENKTNTSSTTIVNSNYVAVNPTRLATDNQGHLSPNILTMPNPIGNMSTKPAEMEVLSIKVKEETTLVAVRDRKDRRSSNSRRSRNPSRK
jgi:hypothetical protein